jgi:lambda family phage portal protein
MNAVDRLIAWVSPRAGLRRAQARAATEIVRRSYDGAKANRTNGGWYTPSTSANTEIATALVLLRDRSRDLVRNNPWAAKAVQTIVDNAIGSGIVPSAATGNTDLDAQIMALWAQFAASCDADGRHDFHGLTHLACRAAVESGEVFLRFRGRRASDGLSVPLQLQLLESDHLDGARSDYFAPGTSNRILYGIEFDGLGRRIGYYLFPDHPGSADVRFRQLTSQRVQASEVLHLYRQDRPEQVRGVPWGAPVIMDLQNLADFDDAELLRQKIAACFALFVERPEGDGAPRLGVEETTNDDGNRVETFEPGMVSYLQPGEEVKFSEPPQLTGYGDFTRARLRAVAAGYGVTYEQLTGDLTQVNYSSYRAGHLEFRRMVDRWRWLSVIPQFCQPVWDRFVAAAFAAGKLPVERAAVRWSPPAFESIDPVKDAEATLLELRMGTRTMRAAVGERGESYAEHMAALAEEKADRERLGLVLDSDPAQTTRNGAARTSAAPAPVADAARASPVSGARRVEVTYDERGVLTGGQIVEDVTALRDAAGSLVGITTGGDR